MADVREIPQLTEELIELSKDYLRQETVEPAKLLGRAVGFSLLAGVLFAFGGVLIAVGAVHVFSDRLPDTELWSAFVLLLVALLTLIVATVVMLWAVRVEPSEVGEES
ncbi:MAG: phage holin family protein [Acidimicrobiia bacterium]